MNKNKDQRQLTKMNDKQLQQFFAEHRQEIDDKGFSDRVTRRLPERRRTPELVWIFACISALVVILTGNYGRMYLIITTVLAQASWWLLPAASCAIALTTILAAAFYERKQAIFR